MLDFMFKLLEKITAVIIALVTIIRILEYSLIVKYLFGSSLAKKSFVSL